MEGDEIGGEKSLWVTYLLWWCFGWSGLHHFYLGRDNQAFVWWSTVGGYLFMGWVRDLWRIPYYVQEANMALKEKRTSEMNRAPIFNASRFLGQIVVGVWYGTLIHLAVPEESLPPFMIGAMSCIGIASGVYLVGSIGSETGPFYNAYFGALSWYVLSTLWGSESVSYSMCSAVASVVFNCSRRYKASHNKDKFRKRLSRMTGRMAIVFLLWSSYFTYNASLTLDNGEKVRLKDSINHFLKSPVWTDFKRTAWTIYEESRQKESWEYVFNDVYEAFDPTGEKHAMKVLEVNAQSSTGEIRRAYKKLAVKWHPDRHKAGEKEAASERFMEIQRAYEILSARKKSSRTRRDATRTEF